MNIFYIFKTLDVFIYLFNFTIVGGFIREFNKKYNIILFFLFGRRKKKENNFKINETYCIFSILTYLYLFTHLF